MYDIENEILTVEDLMEILYVGRNYAYKLLNSGSIKGFKIGRTWRIPKSSIEEFIINSCKSLNKQYK
ncbi:helix-turn-helix domain-containing protein [Mesobacillus jeotgali]|uniref:helix-turn-helix domain-containing protein n=1 Tax=Mesobacillus jeotgali TaxID=129985 RepID=UPI00177C7C8D|nr:helix-turn-helix domain-containing protein [Mesobacillus jeotgali]UYZ22036.1 helix-turn-helix domain-containing protein [Mesobacillus jeotgali]